ncbi:hypothetical protein MSG28_013263, partial [Choristoneura fumiferana]
AVTNLISAEDERLEVMNEDSDDSDRNDDGGRTGTTIALGFTKLGIDGVGKTTILYKIVTGQTVNTIPTVGFNVEKFTHKKVSLSLWDTGRGGKMAPLMRHYYDGTKGIIFVIDSTDNEHIDEAEYELRRLLQEDEFRNAPFLIYANKQDLPNAKSLDELRELYKLHDSRKKCVSSINSK